MAMPRTLRSSKVAERREPDRELPVSTPSCIEFDAANGAATDIEIIRRGSPLPGLDPIADADEIRILRAKQAKLHKTCRAMRAEVSGKTHLANALASTLIFAQYEAGTAVCVGSGGEVLTCAHCFGESDAEWRANRRKWLLYYTGQAVLVECERWDSVRDLALARVVAIEVDPDQMATAAPSKPVFASVQVSPADRPKSGISIICIGQPGRDDLESKTSRKTTYNLVEVSWGSYRGLVPGADPQDCSEIGTLKHDAWTYWGHSGAPLIRVSDGKLIGVHSSWDDQTAMRHGVPGLAIRAFLGRGTEVVDLTAE